MNGRGCAKINFKISDNAHDERITRESRTNVTMLLLIIRKYTIVTPNKINGNICARKYTIVSRYAY